MTTDCIETSVPATSIASRFASQAEAFSALVHDRRVRPGPFKLWHYIRDYGGTSGKSFPGHRTMIKEMGVSGNSIKGWLVELVELRWLDVYLDSSLNDVIPLDELRRKKTKEDAAGARKHYYVILDGAGGPWPGKGKTARKTESGQAVQNSERSDSKTESGPLSKQRTYLNRLEDRGFGGGGKRPSVIDLKDKLEAVRSRREQLKAAHYNGEGLNNCWDSERARVEFVDLGKRERELGEMLRG